VSWFSRILAFGLAHNLTLVSFAPLPRCDVTVRTSQKPGCGADAASVRRLWLQIRRETMTKGTVKWFNPTKGYGFIKPVTGNKDVFVHISAVERAGLSTLNEGQTVEFELVSNRGKESAENLKVA
jgi:CspA family cold shock protein